MKKYNYKWIEGESLSRLHHKLEDEEDAGWEAWGTPFTLDRNMYTTWAINLRRERTKPV